MLSSTWCLAASIGPPIGGSLAAQGKWDWIFCECHNVAEEYLRFSYNVQDLNLPVSFVASVSVIVLLDLPTPPGSYREKFKRMDWM